MISVDEARSRILADLHSTPPEVIALSEALGRVTAAPVLARLTQPPHAVSAMDGYGLRQSDGVQGRALDVIGSAPAGHPFVGAVGVGQAIRIFTGSVLPDGIDAILAQEDAAEAGGRVTVRETTVAGRHIRVRGQDFVLGDKLIEAGRVLTARDIGLAAAANYPWLTVHRKPRVVLCAIGDEIAMPGEPIPPGGIVSSNTHGLAALVKTAGGEATVLPVVADDRVALANLAKHVRAADMLVTTGGASVGEYDLVQSALVESGMVLDFWKIAMRPGKPLIFGKLNGIPIVGLPGNPVSSMVCAALFLMPAIRVLCGLRGTAAPTRKAKLGKPLKANDQREDYLRATLECDDRGELLATAFPSQDSALLRFLAKADAFIRRAPFAQALAAGDEVDVISLSDLGI
jgi:molybdopterin molybdotransferase